MGFRIVDNGEGSFCVYNTGMIDYTLCGLACCELPENAIEPVTVKKSTKITCPRCIEIIDFCKSVPASKIKRPGGK